MHMNIHVLDTEPRPETLDDEPGMAEYALRNHDRPETVVCYLWLPIHQMPFMSKLLRAQAGNAWEAGAEAMCGQDNGGPMAENPFTVREQGDPHPQLAVIDEEPERTWCGKYLCAKAKDHEGECDVELD